VSLNPVSGRRSPVTPPRFRPLGQPETRFADEKVVTQLNAQKDGLFWMVWRVVSIWFDRPKSKLCQLAFGQSSSALRNAETGFKPRILIPKPQTLNPKSYTLNPKP
jgi:hypothetical protein